MAFKLQFVTVDQSGSRKVLDTLVLDASLSEIHDADADVTEFPVEQGSDITDNVRVKPRGLQVEALISDFHLSNNGRSQASSGGPPDAQRPLAGAKGAAKTTYAKLEDYQSKGTLIDVETGLKSYRNMVIKSLHTPRDKNNFTGNDKKAGAIKTTIILQTIIVAKSQNAVIKQSVPKGQGVVSKGQKTAPAAGAGKENESLLVRSKDVPGALKKALNEAASALGGF